MYIRNELDVERKIGFCDSSCKGTWLQNKNPQNKEKPIEIEKY